MPKQRCLPLRWSTPPRPLHFGVRINGVAVMEDERSHSETRKKQSSYITTWRSAFYSPVWPNPGRVQQRIEPLEPHRFVTGQRTSLSINRTTALHNCYLTPMER